jgi:hypothetical protein
MLQTYDDGANDVDCDFNALELELNLDKNIKGTVEALSPLITNDRVYSNGCCGGMRKW